MLVHAAYTPSKMQLITLDFTIIFLQLLLTTIAYEGYPTEGNTNSDTHDILLPMSPSTLPAPATALSPEHTPPFISSMTEHTKSQPPPSSPPYIVDLRLGPLLTRLRSPAVPVSADDSLLPLPTTTPWPLPAGMRSLMRRGQAQRGTANPTRNTTEGESRRVPGDINSDDARGVD